MLPGIGATRAEWEARHVRADSEDYDPDPSLGSFEGHPFTRYSNVYFDDRLFKYVRHFPDSGVREGDALAALKADLPADAQLVWQRKSDGIYGTCLRTAYASPTLAQWRSDRDPQGLVVVETESANSAINYDPAKVVIAYVDWDAPQPATDHC